MTYSCWFDRQDISLMLIQRLYCLLRQKLSNMPSIRWDWSRVSSDSTYSIFATFDSLEIYLSQNNPTSLTTDHASLKFLTVQEWRLFSCDPMHTKQCVMWTKWSSLLTKWAWKQEQNRRLPCHWNSLPRLFPVNKPERSGPCVRWRHLRLFLPSG